MFLDQFNLVAKATDYKFTWNFTDSDKYYLLGVFTEDTLSIAVLRDVCGLVAKCDHVGDTLRDTNYASGSILGARVESVSRSNDSSDTKVYLGLFVRKDLPYWVTSIVYRAFSVMGRICDDSSDCTMILLAPKDFDTWLGSDPVTVDFIDDFILIGVHKNELQSGLELFQQQSFAWKIDAPDDVLLPCSFVRVNKETAIIQPVGEIGLLLPTSFEIPISDLRQLVMNKNAVISVSARMSEWLTEKV